MKKTLALAALLGIAACAEPSVELSEAGEARLAAELRDFEADGPALSCVNMRDIRGNRTVGNGAILFDGPGDRVWVNRPAGGCPSLDHGRALRTRTTGTRLCRGDIASVFDPTSGIEHGSCGLGDFQPYSRRSG